MTRRLGLIAAAALAAFPLAGAAAQDSYKIGMSVGLTGYISVVDRAWRDGALLAVDALNAKGGIGGKKVQAIVEDNRSEPQEAVTVYRKMISSDRVNIFDSGCVSAGNFAAAASVVRAQLPMILCSILPQRPEEQKWAFSFLPPPRFEVETRYQYLKDKTQIRKIGILHDPTPYGLLQKDIAVKIAKDFGLEVAEVQSYKQDDADLSVQIGKINGAGAGAIIKIGVGGSTVTTAKNIKSLDLKQLLLLGSTDDAAILRPAGEVLGERFMFVASAVLLIEALPAGAARDAAQTFVGPWKAKYGEADPATAARAWDSVHMIAKAVESAKSVEGVAVRDAFEKLPEYQGAGAKYRFSAENHVGITANPYFLGMIKGGKAVLVP